MPIFSTTNLTVNQLIENIETGALGLPELQRPFVWSNTKVRDLFDSMMSGYPVGYIMLWECPTLDKTRTIGTNSTKSYDTPREVIIDGQQRLTSLYAVMKGKNIIDKDFRERNIVISFNPLENKFDVGTAAIKNNPEWIYNISDLFTSSTAAKYIRKFLTDLNQHRAGQKKVPLTDNETDKIESRIEELFNIKNYSFPVFKIEASADEEAVSNIFVRINSGGVSLKNNDFILTLLSVHWEEGRRKIEKFCQESTQPNADKSTSYNSLGIEISPQDIIRTVMAYAFNRARLQYGYKLLRGADFDKKGVFSKQLMQANFDILKAKLPDVMNVNNWHEFLKSIMNAGYMSSSMILSDNAIFYTYAMFLIAKNKFSVPYDKNENLASLWFFHALLSSIYTGSFESTVENHLNALKNLKTQDDYRDFIFTRIDEVCTDDFFEVTLSGSGGLAVSGSGNNAWFAYVASLIILGRKVLFSRGNLNVQSLFLPGSDGTRKSLEKHHLFPKAYLKAEGYSETQINQMANYAFIDWKDNMSILNEAPAKYYSEVCKGMTAEEISKMEDENALPHGWEILSYDDFLVQRRKLMAKIIKEAFVRLKNLAKK